MELSMFVKQIFFLRGMREAYYSQDHDTTGFEHSISMGVSHLRGFCGSSGAVPIITYMTAWIVQE